MPETVSQLVTKVNVDQLNRLSVVGDERAHVLHQLLKPLLTDCEIHQVHRIKGGWEAIIFIHPQRFKIQVKHDMGEVDTINI